jgi:uncharacterized protein (TIGR02246 family)
MSQADEDVIREIEDRFNAAWDRHDADGMVDSLTEDAVVITVNGSWSNSREEFRDLMRRLHGSGGPFRDSTRKTPEKHVRMLGPDAAVLHYRFWIDNDIVEDGGKILRECVGTRVMRKVDGQWHTVSVQNTDVRHGRRH